MLGHDGLYEEGSVGFHQVLLGRKGAAQYEQNNSVDLKVVYALFSVYRRGGGGGDVANCHARDAALSH